MPSGQNISINQYNAEFKTKKKITVTTELGRNLHLFIENIEPRTENNCNLGKTVSKMWSQKFTKEY